MTPKELKAAYERGENLTRLLRQSAEGEANSQELVELVYDLQAGQYVKAMKSEKWRAFREESGRNIATVLEELTTVGSLLEPGMGEGTTLSCVVECLRTKPTHLHGFDLSWSRMAHAQRWLRECQLGEAFLSVADLLQMPYADNSFDVVFTSHAVEPNGGRERDVLTELYRVASRFVVLVEPDYEGADAQGKARMENLGYCRGLVQTAEELGFQVVRHERFEPTVNPLNPSALTVIAKQGDAPPAVPKLVCPRYHEPLQPFPDAFYSPASMRAYPVLRGIPCLRARDGIVASAFEGSGNAS